jgi:hypothetical protein
MFWRGETAVSPGSGRRSRRGRGLTRSLAVAGSVLATGCGGLGARFSAGDPFRPVTIRAVYDDEEQGTVIVVWEGRGTTTAGTVYENTYVWIMTLRGGKVVDGTAFYDSIAFNELWQTVTP